MSACATREQMQMRCCESEETGFGKTGMGEASKGLLCLLGKSSLQQRSWALRKPLALSYQWRTEDEDRR